MSIIPRAPKRVPTQGSRRGTYTTKGVQCKKSRFSKFYRIPNTGLQLSPMVPRPGLLQHTQKLSSSPCQGHGTQPDPEGERGRRLPCILARFCRIHPNQNGTLNGLFKGHPFSGSMSVLGSVAVLFVWEAPQKALLSEQSINLRCGSWDPYMWHRWGILCKPA